MFFKRIKEVESLFVDVSNLSNDDNASRSTISNAAYYFFLIGLFLLPLFFIPVFNLPSEIIKTLFFSVVVIVSLFIWIVARLKEGVFEMPHSLLLFLGGIIVLTFGVSALFSPAASVSLSGASFELGTFISMLVLFLGMFLAASLFNTRGKFVSLFLLTFSSFAVLFLFFVLRLVFGADILTFGIFDNLINTPLGKWNDFAAFSGLVAILSLLILESAYLERGARVAVYVFLIASLLVLALANFFLSWIMLGIFSIILLTHSLTAKLLFKNTDEPSAGLLRGRSSPALFIVLVVSIIFILAGSTINGFVVERMGLSFAEVRPSWGSTLDITQKTWSDNLILGSGPNRFVNEWLLHKPDVINASIFWNSDFRFGVGLVPTFVVTTGLFGALAWLAFLLVFLYQGGRALFLSTRRSFSNHITLSSFILALYLWIVVIFYMFGFVVTALAFLLTGVFIAALREQGFSKNYLFSYEQDPRVGFAAVLISIFLLIGIVVSGYEVSKRFIALVYFQKSQTVFRQNGDPDRARGLITSAINLNRTDVFFRALSEIEIARLATLLIKEDVPVETIRIQFQEILGSAIEAGQTATQIDDTSYENWLTLGRVYAAVVPLNISGAYENAFSSLDNASKRNPKSPAIALELARLEAARGDFNTARTQASYAISLKNNYSDAIFFLAQLDVNEGNTKKAVTSLDAATLLDPNNVGLFFQLGLLKYDTKDYAGAIVALERAVTLFPEYSNARYFLGISYYRTKRSADALQQFEIIKSLNPGNEEVERILSNLANNRDPLSGTPPTPSSIGDLDDLPIDEE